MQQQAGGGQGHPPRTREAARQESSPNPIPSRLPSRAREAKQHDCLPTWLSDSPEHLRDREGLDVVAIA
jgi:hypothetical protein